MMFFKKYVVLVLSLAIVSLADVITSSSYANYATNGRSQTTKNNNDTNTGGGSYSNSNANYDVQVPVLIAARPIPTTTMSSVPSMPSMDVGFIPSLFASMMQRANSADYGPNRKNDDSGSSIDSNYDNGYDYYRQRYYATTPSPVTPPKRLYYNNNNNNRNNHDEDNDYNKFNKGTERDQDQRDYGDYYYRGMQEHNYDNYRDYNVRQQRPPLQYNYRNSQQHSRGENQIAPPSSRPLQTTQSQPSSTSSSLDMKNVINRIKFVWDIFVAMNSAWNSVAQQQTKYIKEKKFNMTAESTSASSQAVDSNLPTNFGNATMKNSKGKSTMASKLTSTAAVASATTTTTDSTPSIVVGENDTDETGDEDEGEEDTRRKRDSENAVGEARYIKGDPLKGYYDFVITEGSYKFWAAFQVGTALLIIYSTFAAIYYSKVNPLVSDYDYTDYLGGGRSLSDDTDFVDDSEDGPHAITSSSTSSSAVPSWSDWLPRTGHSLKFILDAVDSLPLQDDSS